MIDPKVAALAQEFQKAVAVALHKAPHLQLDFTWPSVGLLDYLTFHLRDKTSLTKAEELLVAGCAAYLGCMVHDCWTFFPGRPDVKLSLPEGDSLDPTLRVTGGAYLGEAESFELPVATSLRNVLLSPPQPFRFFAKASRHLHAEDNRLSLFALGVFSGLTPYGKGRWSEFSVKDFAPSIAAAELYLAHSAAAHYKRLYPHEMLGQRPEFYIAQQIFPPAGVAEPVLFLRAPLAAFEYLDRQGVESSERQALLLNLCCSLDPQIALSALLASTAALNDLPSERLVWQSERFEHITPLLAPALAALRVNQKEPPHWLHLLLHGQIEKAKIYIAQELRLGFLPLFGMTDEELLDPTLLPLLAAAALPTSQEQREALQKLTPEVQASTAYKVQRLLCAFSDHTLTIPKVAALSDDARKYFFHGMLLAPSDFLRAYAEFDELIKSKSALGEAGRLFQRQLIAKLVQHAHSESDLALLARAAESLPWLRLRAQIAVQLRKIGIAPSATEEELRYLSDRRAVSRELIQLLHLAH